jgi:hypothetical protein
VSAGSVVDRFDWEELVVVAMIGGLRQVSALVHNRPTAHDCDETNAWTYHVNGVAGEVATAKFIDRYWRPLARAALRKLPGDVGKGVQARATDLAYGSLIVHKSDPDDAWFYLVLLNLPSYRIAGRIRGRDAKREEWWREDVPHPAYFVPQRELEAPRRELEAADEADE